MRFRSKDSACDTEGLRVEFEHRDVRKVVLVWVEEFVVVDIVALSEDPLSIWTKERLRRFALDGVAERLLALVRVGQVKLVEDEERHRKDDGEDQDWERHTVDAHPCRLHRDDLAAFLQKPEGDQD